MDAASASTLIWGPPTSRPPVWLTGGSAMTSRAGSDALAIALQAEPGKRPAVLQTTWEAV